MFHELYVEPTSGVASWLKFFYIFPMRLPVTAETDPPNAELRRDLSSFLNPGLVF
jgi:hypothetical protein